MYNITCAALAAYTMRERIMHSVARRVNQIAVVVHEQDYRINDIRNSDQVPKICHCCFCLFVAFACMTRIMYIPEACRLRGSGVDFSLLYPLTWILKACSDEQKAATCWRVAPHARELLATATVALAARGDRRPAPSARRVPTGLQVRLEGEKAKANSYAVVTWVQAGESKGCAGGEGTLGRDGLPSIDDRAGLELHGPFI